MSHEAQTWAIKQRTGSPARKAVLMNLADRADEAWSCFPGQKRIAEDTELGERTVRRALDDLEQAGLLLRFHRRRKDGSWTSDRYVLAGYITDPDAVRLLADSDTCGHSGRRPQRPQATAAAGPAATPAAHPAAAVAGHEPSGSNHHFSPTPDGVGAPELPLDVPPPKPKQRTKIPADWALSPELRAKTVAKAPWLDIDAEVEKFRNHHRAKGERYLDWDLAWLGTWVGNCRPPQQRPGGRPQPYRNTGWADGSASAAWDRFMGQENRDDQQ